ncbi:MAG: entericidin A/B family lipoprotein [Planctomycetota bacterium]|jgi:predicted small secreted protein
MSKHRLRLLMVALVGLVGCLFVGCQTVEGVGKDISSMGEGVSDIARDANPDE